MAPAWSSRASCDPTPCRAHRAPWPTSWDCATWPSRSTTCRRLSIGQLSRAMDWSVASASTRALGGWPTSAGQKGSSSRWPSASAEPRNAASATPRALHQQSGVWTRLVDVTVGRELSWQGCVNIRDLGGLGQLRSGAVVRMEAPTRLSEAGWAAAWAYGVRTVVDLRHAEECG